MERPKPRSGGPLPLAWLASALALALIGWLTPHIDSPSADNFAAYYVDQHRGAHFALAMVFALVGAIYFAIGRGANLRSWRHLAWGQFALTLAGVLLMESPALAFSRSGSPWHGQEAVVAFHFWTNAAAAGDLATLRPWRDSCCSAIW
jgi:hypothetical protein